MLPKMDILIAYNGHAKIDARGIIGFAIMLPVMDILIAYNGHTKMGALGINILVCNVQSSINVSILLIGLICKFELIFFT